MFGKNPIRPILRDPLQLAVEEIFYTIQGEGPQGGRPALFIRLAGCNLACTFCDTQFDTRADMPESTAALFAKILADFTPAQRRLVVLTGGEPMRQNWAELGLLLLQSGTELIQVETAGTCWQHDLDELMRTEKIQIVCSPKTPAVHLEIRRHCTHYKYVVRGGAVDAADGLPNRGTQLATQDRVQLLYRPWPYQEGQRYDNFPRWYTVWVSPCDDQDPELNRVNQDLARDLCLKYGYRLSLQIHKLIGVA